MLPSCSGILAEAINIKILTKNHPDSLHSLSDFPHPHSDSLHSQLHSPHSHPDSPRIPRISNISTPIPRIPTLIPHIPTLIPHVPTLILRVPIIPPIPFPDSPFRLLQIARYYLRFTSRTYFWAATLFALNK